MRATCGVGPPCLPRRAHEASAAAFPILPHRVLSNTSRAARLLRREFLVCQLLGSIWRKEIRQPPNFADSRDLRQTGVMNRRKGRGNQDRCAPCPSRRMGPLLGAQARLQRRCSGQFRRGSPVSLRTRRSSGGSDEPR